MKFRAEVVGSGIRTLLVVTMAHKKWALHPLLRINVTQNPFIFLYSSSVSRCPLILLSKSSLILVGTRERPLGSNSSTRSSKLILSSPLVLMISIQCFFNSSFHPHSINFCLRYSSSRSFSPLSSSFLSIMLFFTAIS